MTYLQIYLVWFYIKYKITMLRASIEGMYDI